MKRFVRGDTRIIKLTLIISQCKDLSCVIIFSSQHYNVWPKTAKKNRILSSVSILTSTTSGCIYGNSFN